VWKGAEKMKTRTVEDKATMETALDSAKQDLTMLAEEMRSWADNMDGTGLENTQRYERVDEAASQLEEAQSSLEDVEIPDELKTREVTFHYLMPKSRYIGRSWRLGQVVSALRALSESLPEATEGKDEISSQADELETVEFPGMYD
jgi:hypothetical protein